MATTKPRSDGSKPGSLSSSASLGDHKIEGGNQFMPVERAPGGTSLIDVLDRVLDKGIIIDAWVRVSLVGIDLVTVEARVVVASIDTYLRYADALGLMQSRPGMIGTGTGSQEIPPARSRTTERA